MSLLDDELLTAQALRTLGTAGAGGAEPGEVLTALRALRGTDLDAWHAAWTNAGERALLLAERAGDRAAARHAYLRAGNYFRTAGVMALSPATWTRARAADARQREHFSQAFELLDVPAQRLHVPFEGGTLPGWFFPAADDDRRRATVVLTGGYDGPCEELFLLTGAAALERGYNVLAFDGPGQGAALFEHDLRMRPDWETVVAAVLDLAVEHPAVDPDRIALIGLSLGAHLAPRAASAEPRLAALIADCGAFDLHEAFLSRLPGPLAAGLRDDRRWARRTAAAAAPRLAAKPTAGWALRRGMLVHGAATPLEYLDALREYTLRDRAERITCPTWVCNAENDDIGASAPELVADLRCRHAFVQFKAADGAGDHCEAGARALYHATSFDWLDALLQPRASWLSTIHA